MKHMTYFVLRIESLGLTLRSENKMINPTPVGGGAFSAPPTENGNYSYK